MIVTFSGWVIDVRIGCGHPFIDNWHPFLAESIAKCSLPDPDTEQQRQLDGALTVFAVAYVVINRSSRCSCS